MSLNVDSKSIMDQSLIEINSLARARQEHARDERWQAVVNKIKDSAKRIIYSDSNQLVSFSGRLEEGMKTWLQEKGNGIRVTKALFKIDVQTKITPIVRVFPVQRDGQTWQKTETVERKGIIKQCEFVKEDSEGINLANFELDTIDFNEIQAPLDNALSFALSIGIDLHETIDSEPLCHREWVVLG